MTSISRPVKTCSAQDECHVKQKIFHLIGRVIERKIERKVLDQEFRLKKDVLDEIYKQKSDPDEAIRRAKAGKELVNLIGPKALRDTQRLLRGELTQENAELGYGDKRIFEVEIPDHLEPVLTANGHTRNICLIHKMVEITHHVDKNIALDIAKGFVTIGPSPVTGLWPLRDNSGRSEKSVKDFYEAEMTLKKHRPKLDSDILEHIIDEIESDMKRGRYREISREMLKVQPMLAFGVRQKEKIRIIIDERMKNAFSTLSEKLILKGTSYLIEAIRAFLCEPGLEGQKDMMPGSQRAKAAYKSILEELRDWKEISSNDQDLTGTLPSDIAEAMKRRNLRRAILTSKGKGPSAGLRDFRKAYYQVGCASPGENSIQAYDPKLNIWRYFEANSLTMGNTHNVTNWCRIAEAAEWFSRKLGGLVQFIYIDDSTTLAVNDEVLLVQMDFLDNLNAHLGLEISDKAEARQDSINDECMTVLGLEYRFKPEQTSITVPDKKKAKIIDLSKKLINDLGYGKAVHHDFQVLIGNLVYALYSSGEKSGHAVLQGVYPWFDENYFNKWVRNRDRRRALVRSLHFIITITREMKPVILNKENAVRPVVHLFTDASTDGGPNGGGGLGAVLLSEDGSWRTTTLEVPTERIDILELKAVLLGLETFELKGKEIICHVDNAGDIYALIRGVHKTQRGSAIIHQVYRNLFHNNSSVFWDYIKSEANIADFFTRIEKEALGLEWTGSTLEEPKHELLDEIDEDTREVQLGEPTPQGDVPGWWLEELEIMVKEVQNDENEVEEQLSSNKNNSKCDWEDEIDWTTWNARARKLADELQEDCDSEPERGAKVRRKDNVE